jgi:hypothetical protein
LSVPDGFDSLLLSTSEGEEERSTGTYRHEYVLFESFQCLPLYLVQFETSRHSSNKEPDNVYDRCDFFDPVYYVPVSIRDKMVGSHSRGEAAQHKLISLQVQCC